MSRKLTFGLLADVSSVKISVGRREAVRLSGGDVVMFADSFTVVMWLSCTILRQIVRRRTTSEVSFSVLVFLACSRAFDEQHPLIGRPSLLPADSERASDETAR